MKKFLLIVFLAFTNLSAFANPDKIDMTNWKYNSAENVFYQLGIKYCDNPSDEKIEKMAVFVPSEYFKCEANSDETYSCTVNKQSKIKEYSIKTAPIVMPINTSKNYALTDYISVWEYTKEGFIYVQAGSRGLDDDVIKGVTDYKAAIKYIRYNKNLIPWNTNRIFTFGMGHGGAQSVLLGTTGDSKQYNPYLKEIGAIEGISDSIYGSASWCPITSLDIANEAYEWNMGSSRKDLDEETKKVSNDMAMKFAEYINETKFRNKDGNLLELRPTNSGIYKGGSYYNYIEKQVNQSLTNFLFDNLFPVDMNTYGKEILSQDIEVNEESENNAEELDKSKYEDLVFKTPQDYINYLNKDKIWVNYDSSAHSAKISNLDDFVKHMKPATKPVGSFKNSENVSDPLYFIMPAFKGYKTSKVAKYWRIRSGISQTDISMTTEINLALALKRLCGDKNVDFETVWAMGHVKAERRGTPDENIIKWVNKCLTKSKKL